MKMKTSTGNSVQMCGDFCHLGAGLTQDSRTDLEFTKCPGFDATGAYIKILRSPAPDLNFIVHEDRFLVK